MKAVIAGAQQRTAEAAEKNAVRAEENRQRRLATRGPSAADIEGWFRGGIRLLRGPGHKIAAWTGKERSLGKKLVKEYGADLVQEAIKEFCANWEDYVRRSGGRLHGDPSVALLWVMRASVFARAQGVEAPEFQERRGKAAGKGKNTDEYDPSKVDDDDMGIGW